MTLVVTTLTIRFGFAQKAYGGRASGYLTKEIVGINGETIMRNWGDIWLGVLARHLLTFNDAKALRIEASVATCPLTCNPCKITV